MKDRKEIISDLTEKYNVITNTWDVSTDNPLMLEILLDIRDQNEEIKSQLSSIKTWSSKY